MSADHRKPVVAFVLLAFLAAALVGVQRADAQAGRLLAAALDGDVHAQGQVRVTSGHPAPSALPEAFTLTSRLRSASARPEAAALRARKAQVSRGHGRLDTPAPAAADRHRTRSGASGEPRPGDRAAEQARAAVSKLLPGRALAKGRTSAEQGHRPGPSRSTR